MDYDELVCTLCSFQFDEEQRLPLMIPQCGHSFCSNCLQGLLDKSDSDQKFICPEDKTEIELPNRNISQFPKNLTLIRLLEKRKSLKTQERNSDMHLYQNILPPNIQDETLSEKMENLAKGRISVPRISTGNTSNKESHSLEMSFRSEENLCANLDPNFCPEHGREYEVVCLDHKCRICTNCALFGSHKNHEIRQEDEVFREIALRAEKLIDIFQVIEKEHSSIYEQGIEKKLGFKVKAKYNELAGLIHEKFNEYVEMIRAKERKILEEIEQKLKVMEDKFKEVNQIPYDLQDRLGAWKSKAENVLLSVTEKSEKREIAFEMLEDKNNKKDDLLNLGQQLINGLQKINQTSTKPFEEVLSRAAIVFNNNFLEGLNMTYELSIPTYGHSQEIPPPHDGLNLRGIQSLQSLQSHYNLNNIQNIQYQEFLRHQNIANSMIPDGKRSANMKTGPSHKPSMDLQLNNIESDLDEFSCFVGNSFGMSSTTKASRKWMDGSNSLLDHDFREPILTERSSNVMRLNFENSVTPPKLVGNNKQRPPINRDRENQARLANQNANILIQDHNYPTAPQEHISLKFQQQQQTGKKDPSRAKSNENLHMMMTFRDSLGGSVSPPKGNDIISSCMKNRRKTSIKVSDKFDPIIEGIRRKAIETADLSGAGLGDAGVAKLAEYLVENNTLKTLKLVKNKITDEGAQVLIEALYYNNGLRALNLGSNLLTERTLDAFIELLKNKNTIKTIHFNQNCAGTASLRQKLKEITKLGVNIVT